MKTAISEFVKRLEEDGDFTITAATQSPDNGDVWRLTVTDNRAKKSPQDPNNAQASAATRQNAETTPEADLAEAAKILKEMLATYNGSLKGQPESLIRDALTSGNADKIRDVTARTKAYLARKGIKVA